MSGQSIIKEKIDLALIEKTIAVILLIGISYSTYIHLTQGPTILIIGDFWFGLIMISFVISPPHSDDK